MSRAKSGQRAMCISSPKRALKTSVLMRYRSDPKDYLSAITEKN